MNINQVSADMSIIAQQSIFLFGGAKIEAEAECIILKICRMVMRNT